MAAIVRSGPLVALSKSVLNSPFLFQKAGLKNEAISFSIREKDAPSKEINDVRFPENMKWGENLAWSHSSSFHRRIGEYQVPADVEDTLAVALDSVLGAAQYNDRTPLTDLRLLGLLLCECGRRLNHHAPNYLLHLFNTVGDVREFYRTGIDRSSPLDQLSRQNLPANLCVLTEYQRFNPDTDTMFGGISAFPHSSTVVTSIKYKRKYPGHTVKKPYPWANSY